MLLAYVDDSVRQAEFPVSDVRHLIAERLGLRVRTGTVRQWRRRMTLTTWCRVDDQAEVCRVGDYLDLAKSLHDNERDTPSDDR